LAALLTADLSILLFHRELINDRVVRQAMHLVRLVYASTISDSFKPQDMESLLTKARAHNTKLGVTGLLCFNRNYFLQCLEGGRAGVNEVYRKILNDPRHTDAVLLDYREIVKRQFSDWKMGYVPEKAITDEINLMYAPTARFNPYDMHAESAHDLLLALAKQIPLS